MALSNYLREQILDGLVGNKDTFGTDTVYIGLSSTAPNPDATGITEPEGNGYKRALLGSNDSHLTRYFERATGTATDSVTNITEIYFAESSGSWGNPLTHFVIFSAETKGNMLAYAELTTPVTVSADKQVVMFRPGTLTVRFID